MRVIGSMLLGYPLLRQMRFYALTRLRLLVYVRLHVKRCAAYA